MRVCENASENEQREGGEGGRDWIARRGEQYNWNGNGERDGSRQMLRASGAKLPCSGRVLVEGGAAGASLRGHL